MKRLPPENGKPFLENLRCKMNKNRKADRADIARGKKRLRPLIALYEEQLKELASLQQKARRLLLRDYDEERITKDILTIINQHPQGIYTADIYKQLGCILKVETLREWLLEFYETGQIKRGFGQTMFPAWFPTSADINPC